MLGTARRETEDSSMSDRRLWDLAEMKDWPAMHRLLDESSDEVKEQLVTFRYEGGVTAIYVCVESGAPDETAHALLQAGPRGYINVKVNGGYTPAMYAALGGRADMLRQFINAGADPNIRRTNGDTARDTAVRWKRPNCVAVLDDYAAAVTYFMCVERYDDHHIWQCENVNPNVLHPLIVELEESEERLVSNWTPTGEGLARPEISGMFLHDLHGKEKGISRLILKFLFGPKEKKEGGP